MYSSEVPERPSGQKGREVTDTSQSHIAKVVGGFGLTER